MFVTGSFPFEEAVMRFQGAVLKERGITFAVVVVKPHVIENGFEAETNARSLRKIFPGIPVALMARDFDARPSYYGPEEIVAILKHMPFNAIPWREYQIS